jgi:hypothetical protein
MPYLVRYRLSSRFNLEQGNVSHSKQKGRRNLLSFLQFRITHFLQYSGTIPSEERHPSHLFFDLKYPIQSAQFMPHGAILFRQITPGVLFLISKTFLPVIGKSLKHLGHRYGKIPFFS